MTKETVVQEKAPVRRGKGTQQLVRHLIENPDKVTDFLMHPRDTALALGLVVEADDLEVLQLAILEMRCGAYEFKLAAAAQHADFPECDHVEVSRPKRELVIYPA